MFGGGQHLFTTPHAYPSQAKKHANILDCHRADGGSANRIIGAMPSKNLPNRKKREQVRRGNPKELPIWMFLRAKRRRKQQNKLQETLIRSVARQDTLQHEKMDILAF